MNFESIPRSASSPTSPVAPADALPDIIEVPIPILEPDLDLEVPLAAESREIDPESVVEEAELLLREGAPHDFDLLVIGGGPGGLTAAIRAAQGGLQVALVDTRIGGAYLHDGCIASKVLLEAATISATVAAAVAPDLAAAQLRKAELVTQLQLKMRAELEVAGVQTIAGRARFVEQHTLEIQSEGQTRRVTAVHVVIAVGGVPQRPEFESAALVTSDEMLRQSGAPPRLVVVGAGTVGVELAALFAASGSRVTLLEPSDAILPGFDEDIQADLRRHLERSGIVIETGVAVARVDTQTGVARLILRRHSEQFSSEAEQVLWATGRVAQLEKLGLEAANIEVSGGKIAVETDFQTATSGVYAIGDCIRKSGWASQAVRDGHQVAGVILGLTEADSHFTPLCCYTSPEVASVGLTLSEALELGIAAQACRGGFGENVRSMIQKAVRSEGNDGFVKLVYDSQSGRIIGCQIIGAGATELINEAALAMRAEMTLRDVARVHRCHPSRGEVFADAARLGLGDLGFDANVSE